MQLPATIRAAFVAPLLLLLAACGGSSDAPQDTVPIADLMAPQALPDITVGDPNAPVTVIEYASMTCPHCAAFHNGVYDDFKATYIDTGKVYFIFREFPLDATAAAASQLARCVPGGNEGYMAMVDVLYETQAVWAQAADRVAALQQMGAQAGISADQFNACFANQATTDGIYAVHDRGIELGVNATPTFFVNGAQYAGEIEMDRWATIIDPLL
ncbi:MAG: DsbA family protein [Bauldia sp.]|nr:DsbA family protein [Bauldia sp.]